MTKPRWFVITDWNLNTRDTYEEIVAGGQIRFIAYGLETCPNSGKLHNQAYCYFWNPQCTGIRSLKKIGDMFGKIHCFVKPMYGRVQHSEAYCSKETELVKIGEEPKQGARGDLDECKELIMQGKLTADDVCIENPIFFHQYGRTLDRIESIALRKQWRKEMTQGIWITGPSGAGKSTTAFKGYNPDTHYVKDLNTKWWDGYKGQEIVILNEFRGQVAFWDLMDLVDMHPKMICWRNRESVPFLAKKVIITSIKDPYQCYLNIESEDEPWTQFERRFKIIVLEQRCSKGNISTLEQYMNQEYELNLFKEKLPLNCMF